VKEESFFNTKLNIKIKTNIKFERIVKEVGVCPNLARALIGLFQNGSGLHRLGLPFLEYGLGLEARALRREASRFDLFRRGTAATRSAAHVVADAAVSRCACSLRSEASRAT
jgi:hypothetical protein